MTHLAELRSLAEALKPFHPTLAGRLATIAAGLDAELRRKDRTLAELYADADEQALLDEKARDAGTAAELVWLQFLGGRPRPPAG